MVRGGIVKSDNSKVAMILGAGDAGARLIEVLNDMGIMIESVYDNTLDATGIVLTRKMKIPTFAGDSSQLVTMLKECQEHPEKQYNLFLASEYPRFVELVDAKSRSQRRRSKNFRLFRLGIDFDEDTTHMEYLQLW
jgi:homoserine dehydrogenase